MGNQRQTPSAEGSAFFITSVKNKIVLFVCLYWSLRPSQQAGHVVPVSYSGTV